MFASIPGPVIDLLLYLLTVSREAEITATMSSLELPFVIPSGIDLRVEMQYVSSSRTKFFQKPKILNKIVVATMVRELETRKYQRRLGIIELLPEEIDAIIVDLAGDKLFIGYCNDELVCIFELVYVLCGHYA